MSKYCGFQLNPDAPRPIPKFQFHETTMQVPCAEYSIFYALRKREVTAAEAIVYLSLNHGSSWDTGRAWYVSHRALAARLGMSPRRVRSILKKLEKKGWIIPIPMTHRRKRYQLVHHLCDDEDVPIDGFGKPLKFAVPRGMGGPFERLYLGDISWKACLVWIIHKLNSNWKTGETYGSTIREFAKSCRLGQSTITASRRELMEAEMLERLSKPHERSVFQLYPKPQPKPTKKKKKKKGKSKAYELTTDGKHWYSHNRKYRCCRETARIEYLKGNRKWHPLSDHDLYRMPKAIRRDFDMAVEVNRSLLASFRRNMHTPSRAVRTPSRAA